MDLLDLKGYNLRNLDRQNFILGKNGCGKSRLLKELEQGLRSSGVGVGVVKYVSPERAGVLQYEPGIEQAMTSSSTWLGDTRRKNQAEQFRQQSTAQFRRLELLVLREIEKTPELRLDVTQTFDTVVKRINTLLDRVYIERGDPSFVIKDRKTLKNVSPSEISSGESELISLGIECLVFVRECEKGKLNALLLDEPDVHLHPDLQARFGRFLMTLLAEADVTLFIATHSTAFLGATATDAKTRIAFLRHGDTDLTFAAVDDTHKRILPVFGAHPLSNIFNEAPVLLVEGDDDERIWQQAVRSAAGAITIYPVAVDSVDKLSNFESEVARILEAVYDDAVGYSLRDRDVGPAEIDNVGPIRRYRLRARAAENLLLSDDVLLRVGVDWNELQRRISAWTAANSAHPHFGYVQAFERDGFKRRDADLKEIRNDLVGLMGSNKPWEVLVGQAIAALAKGNRGRGPNSLYEYLGSDLCQALLHLSN